MVKHGYDVFEITIPLQESEVLEELDLPYYAEVVDFAEEHVDWGALEDHLRDEALDYIRSMAETLQGALKDVKNHIDAVHNPVADRIGLRPDEGATPASAARQVRRR